jgi:hypothetical protein
MGPTLFIVFSIAFSAFTAWLAMRVMNRSAVARGTDWPSPIVAVLAIGSWAVLSVVSLSLALSTTTRVRTAIVLRNMAGRPPFAAIASHDQEEWRRLAAAVSNALDSSSGMGMRDAVARSVSEELGSYMNRRLSRAPDGVYLALAPIVAEAERSSEALGGCVVPGDRRSGELLRHTDARRLFAWSTALVETPPALPAQAVPDRAETARRKAELARQEPRDGLSRVALAAAMVPDAQAPGRCAAAAATLDAAARNGDARDVRTLLDGLALPG